MLSRTPPSIFHTVTRVIISQFTLKISRYLLHNEGTYYKLDFVNFGRIDFQ